VHRQEIYDEIQRSNREAVTRGGLKIPKLPSRTTAQPAVATAPKLAACEP
jgi:hypothetical protein